MAQQTDADSEDEAEEQNTERESQALAAFHRYVWYEVQGE